jgi:hypothetical protein
MSLGALFVGTLPGVGADIDFSTDGKRVAFTWPAPDGKPSLVVGDMNGGPTQALPGTQAASGAKWSPNGKRLLYHDEAAHQTLVWDADTGRSVRLPVELLPPYAWREDSLRVAGTTRSRTGAFELVFVALGELGVAHRTAVPAEAASLAAIVWLGQTDEVAFLGQKNGLADIYITDGGIPMRITTTSDVIGLGLTPNRRNLLFARPSRNPGYILCTLFRYNVAKRSVEKLPFPDRVAAVNPSPNSAPAKVEAVWFSPNGAGLAMLTTWQRPTGARVRIHAMQMDGTNARPIADLPARGGLLSGFAWTTDSAGFAALVIDGFSAQLYLTDAATGARRGLYKK